MAYDDRYEPQPGYVLTGIVAATKSYLKGDLTYSGTTNPTLIELEQYIDRNVSDVAIRLAKSGYDVNQPVADVGVLVARHLSDIVIYGSLMEIERGKVNQVLGRGETSRWTIMKEERDRLRDELAGTTLEYMGAVRLRSASDGMMVTGRTWSEEDDIEDDYDQKGASFRRDEFDEDARRSRFERDDYYGGRAY